MYCNKYFSSYSCILIAISVVASTVGIFNSQSHDVCKSLTSDVKQQEI